MVVLRERAHSTPSRDKLKPGTIVPSGTGATDKELTEHLLHDTDTGQAPLSHLPTGKARNSHTVKVRKILCRVSDAYKRSALVAALRGCVHEATVLTHILQIQGSAYTGREVQIYRACFS